MRLWGAHQEARHGGALKKKKNDFDLQREKPTVLKSIHPLSSCRAFDLHFEVQGELQLWIKFLRLGFRTNETESGYVQHWAQKVSAFPVLKSEHDACRLRFFNFSPLSLFSISSCKSLQTFQIPKFTHFSHEY